MFKSNFFYVFFKTLFVDPLPTLCSNERKRYKHSTCLQKPIKLLHFLIFVFCFCCCLWFLYLCKRKIVIKRSMTHYFCCLLHKKQKTKKMIKFKQLKILIDNKFLSILFTLQNNKIEKAIDF